MTRDFNETCLKNILSGEKEKRGNDDDDEVILKGRSEVMEKVVRKLESFV